MAEHVAIPLPVELVDRATALASRSGRSRSDIIESALSVGLRDQERMQTILDDLDEVDIGEPDK